MERLKKPAIDLAWRANRFPSDALLRGDVGPGPRNGSSDPTLLRGDVGLIHFSRRLLSDATLRGDVGLISPSATCLQGEILF